MKFFIEDIIKKKYLFRDKFLIKYCYWFTQCAENVNNPILLLHCTYTFNKRVCVYTRPIWCYNGILRVFARTVVGVSVNPFSARAIISFHQLFNVCNVFGTRVFAICYVHVCASAGDRVTAWTLKQKDIF